MFVPLISSEFTRKLFRRKGGGGNGRGSSTTTNTSKSSGSSSKGPTSITQHRTGYSGATKKKKKSKVKSSSGTPNVPVAIPAGRLFAGRNEGGGTRQGIYGTATYGSGYPASYAPATQAGTAGLGFPYYFWPVVWGGVGYNVYDYRYNTEYGDTTNSSRPGGPLVFVTYPSTGSKAGTFRILSDNGTIIDLIDYIAENCTSVLPSDSLHPSPVAYTVPPPHPDHAIQYYRASTVALTFDAFNASSSTPPATFTPSADTVDPNILNCLNYTIGTNARLDDGAFGLDARLGLLWIAVGLVSVMTGSWI